MCGVVGLVYEKHRPDLGRIAAELLKTLEYRGYDSTGAAIQGHGEDVWLGKGVGAPSVMVHTLGIVDRPGQILCGQVRWATFGAVTDANSQPHAVRCKIAMYGAHNGNVTNCDALKMWLTDEGHRVLSDNDGEMVVHTVEHYFAREIGELPVDRQRDPASRRACMRTALVAAAARLEGSFAAVVVDPVSRCAWAVKQGSSLYFGIGRDDIGGRFAVASSDLSSVLKLTRVVVPMLEGEFMEFDAQGHRLFAVCDKTVQTPTGANKQVAGQSLERAPVRSRLRAKDTALVPPFETFMDQEISAQEETCRAVIRLFQGGSESAQGFKPVLETAPEATTDGLWQHLEALRDEYADELIRQRFHELVDDAGFRALLATVPAKLRANGDELPAERVADTLHSSEAGFLTDLLPMARDAADVLAVRVLDALLEGDEATELAQAIAKFTEYSADALSRGGRLFVVCCGSSYNAARAAALFFNELARTDLVPLLPGEFRERITRSLRDGDMLIAVSQSGETKDLIDVMNDTIASGCDIKRIGIVNNVNSTLAIEKSDLVIPLRCGPEIAVPATKSFINQMAVFYCLALHFAEHRSRTTQLAQAERNVWTQELALRREKLPNLPSLLRAAFDATQTEIEEAAQLLCLKPSIHLLAIRMTALAREGALKIREVVLNHAEGFEGSEFKHGPNTILGFNTILGPQQVDALLRAVGQVIDGLVQKATAAGMGPDAHHRLIQAVTDAVFSPTPRAFALTPAEKALFDAALDRQELVRQLYADYPLIYLTGPDERDVALLVSQINTHKIRGSSTIVIAEDHPALRQAAGKPPVDNPVYRSVYIPLPRTDDTLMAVFSATIVLQRLALRMSLLKMQYLDRLGIQDHGVHPDVPKNVSKSITVD
jgi:glucosamine--fructose-6-phosphate aminotransferase (isomerizing)